MGEERKQQPGGRYWLIPPYSCLVSGSSWAEGWLGAATGVLRVPCRCVLWRSYVGAGPGCGRVNLRPARRGLYFMELSLPSVQREGWENPCP